mgnify:CR=1 FL=1
MVASEAVTVGNPGDLGVRTYGSSLLVPSSLYNALAANALVLTVASDFFLFFQEKPHELAGILGWTFGSVRRAHWELGHQLRGHIADEYISLPQRDVEEPLPDLLYVVPNRRWKQ